MTKEDLLNMGLHNMKSICCGDDISVLRVVGGWLYTYNYLATDRLSTVFVPESNLNTWVKP